MSDLWDRGKLLYRGGRSCPKCGYHIVESKHVTFGVFHAPDMIRRRCQRCDATWDEIPLDRPPAPRIPEHVEADCPGLNADGTCPHGYGRTCYCASAAVPESSEQALSVDLFILQEAIASVSLSHDEDCRCLTCRAALGDPRAMAEMLAHLTANDSGQE